MSAELVHRIDKLAETMERRFDELRRHMHVLHEDAIARIAATEEADSPTRTEMRRGFVEVIEAVGRRTDPLEVLGRDHEKRITKLEKGRR